MQNVDFMGYIHAAHPHPYRVTFLATYDLNTGSKLLIVVMNR